MGTGIIIDPRGYIVTNHHVVDDVHLAPRPPQRRHDAARSQSSLAIPKQDLAVIKIDPTKPLPIIPLGTSSDLMLARDGHRHRQRLTAMSTRSRPGIVSAFKRDVTLNKEVSYKALIQTERRHQSGQLRRAAAQHLRRTGRRECRHPRRGTEYRLRIADRQRAQSDRRNALGPQKRTGMSHGMVLRDAMDTSNNPIKRWAVVDQVEPGSAAAQAGFKAGDVVEKVGDVPVRCALDVERAFLEQPAGAKMEMVALRSRQRDQGRRGPQAGRPRRASNSRGQRRRSAWKRLGREGEPCVRRRRGQGQQRPARWTAHYRREPRKPCGSPGRLRKGDVLIGLHQWETISADNVSFVLNHPDLAHFSPVKYFLIHDGQLRRGFLPGID